MTQEDIVILSQLLDQKFEPVYTRLDLLESDVRELKSGMSEIKQRVASVEQKVTELDQRVAGVEQKVTELDEKVTELDQKFTVLDEKVTVLDQKFTVLDQKFTVLDEKVTGLELVIENETNVKKTEKEEKTSDKIEEEIAEKNEDILPQVKVIPNFDSCPAFTELDNKLSYYNDLLFQRKNKLFENPSLPDIVQFVVDYARESRLHLSYTPQTIAKFVAGLGATKLSILQGMSGTGKTSLPKIFLEALMGNCEIVEVESSWKDKNELIGY